MVAGSLQEKNGKYYIVLSYKDAMEKPRTKWKSTGLPVKGNKKKAEAMLMEARRSFEPISSAKENDVLFSDYLLIWLETIRHNIELTTYAAYSHCVKPRIVPYFEKKSIKLTELHPNHIREFYAYCMDDKNGYGVGVNTVIHYHAIMHNALQYAVKTDIILYNPMLKVDRPKKKKFISKYYDREEMCQLFDFVKGSDMELVIVLAGFYGFRRSEVLGLKWEAIDFENKTISILHTITQITVDGKFLMVAKDNTKTPASRRTLPLVPIVEELLLNARQAQKENRRVCGKCYNQEYIGYIIIDEMGNIRKPNYVSKRFKDIIRNNDMREIRFHDLRHSCASLLLANGVNMKNIQEWLGHSNFSTTADVYSHLDYNTKITSANIMHGLLQKNDSPSVGQ